MQVLNIASNVINFTHDVVTAGADKQFGAAFELPLRLAGVGHD
jgi:hypothetical protein